jgi:alpha-tubulin suppressor-like RCC1 family protein
MAYEKFDIKGSIGTKVVRPVKLQVWSRSAWRTVARTSTDKKGRYTFTISTARSKVKVRVYAKKVRVHHRTYQKSVSKARTITTRAQSSFLTVSKILLAGQPFQATGTTRPIRNGRQLQLQALRASGWVVVDSTVEDNHGEVTFTATHDAANLGYRMVAARFKGAPASTSATTRVTTFVNDHAKATQVSVGTHHTCALTEAGTVRCWGDNDLGELGDGTVHVESFSNLPSQVVGLPAKVVSITAGDQHTCAITENHTAWCWGNNSNGQLGDGTTTDRGKPVQVKGLTNVISISAGDVSTCAVVGATPSATSGAAKCWGNNYRGKLGDGTTTGRKLPTQVSGLTSGVTAISTGVGHTCAVTSAHTAKCWGDGTSGQLGSGAATISKVPVAVKNLTGVTTISAGSETSCATTTGAAWCWGSAYVSDTKWRDDLIPVEVTGLSTGVSVIAAGVDTCAVQAGAAKCWGANDGGTVGDGTRTGRANPVTVTGLGSGVSTIATGLVRIWAGAGTGHSCAVTTTGSVQCWGDNLQGELGDSSVESTTTPVITLGFA